MTRVIYDKELFNYEEYQSRGLNDERLLSKVFFLRNGKALMADYWKFQKQQCSKVLYTPNLITKFLSKLSIFVANLE